MRQFRPGTRAGGGAGFFSSARRLRLPPGQLAAAGGYHLDLRAKAPADAEPFPEGLPRGHGFVGMAQAGLGYLERLAAGEGEEHLARAAGIGRHLLRCQCRAPGVRFGGFLHEIPYEHGRPLRPPWLSAMAQGEAASLLVRLSLATGDDAFAEGAVDALAPIAEPVAAGGAAGELDDGGFFPEEYPTEPQSHVLNGGIFALWGLRDVGSALALERWNDLFAAGVDSLARNVGRWSIGYWSRYDLYPFRPLLNPASSFYHVLHADQLAALGGLTGDERLLDAGRAFERQYELRAARLLAFAHKAAFRLAVRRHPVAPAPRPRSG